MQRTVLSLSLHYRDLRPTTEATVFENKDGSLIACLDLGADNTRESISVYFHRPGDLRLIASEMERAANELESKQARLDGEAEDDHFAEAEHARERASEASPI